MQHTLARTSPYLFFQLGILGQSPEILVLAFPHGEQVTTRGHAGRFLLLQLLQASFDVV